MSANRKVKDLEEHAAASFEAAELRQPKLPEIFIPIDVDTVLGVDASLRNAVFQIGLGDTEGVRRCIQDAIKKLYPAFEETGKALTGKMEENPPGYDVSAKILIASHDHDALISALEHYVALIKDRPVTWHNTSNGRSSIKATYSADRAKPVAVLLTRERRRELEAQHAVAPKGSEVRWPASWGQELGD